MTVVREIHDSFKFVSDIVDIVSEMLVSWSVAQQRNIGVKWAVFAADYYYGGDGVV